MFVLRPTARNFRKRLPHPLQPRRKLPRQEYVRVHVREKFVARVDFRLRKNIRQQRRPLPVPRHFRHVPQPQLPRALRRSLFRPKQKYLRPRLQLRPARNRIPLDHSDMPQKRLRHRQNCDLLLVKGFLLAKGAAAHSEGHVLNVCEVSQRGPMLK